MLTNNHEGRVNPGLRSFATAFLLLLYTERTTAEWQFQQEIATLQGA
jgi:hypothetical protein